MPTTAIQATKPAGGTRTILAVIDGLGVGSPDPGGPHTLRTILAAHPTRRYPTLEHLGLLEHAYGGGAVQLLPRSAAPDTYLGHLEMLGTVDQPQRQLLDHATAEITAALPAHDVRRGPAGVLLVDETIAVYDNLDGDPGLSLIVLSGLDTTGWHELLAVARAVRAATQVPRVIAASAAPLNVPDAIARHARTVALPLGCARGLHTQQLLHGRYCRYRHLPYRPPGGTLLDDLTAAGVPVTLVGKVADLFPTFAARFPTEDTTEVVGYVLDALDQQPHGLIWANMQAIDLAGHAGNPQAAATALADIDEGLAAITAALRPGDELLVTADHGNDPGAGARHTTETVPLLHRGEHPPQIDPDAGLAVIGQLVRERHHAR